MKRQRGRGRRPGGGGGGGGGQHHQHQHPNRAMESSGPEVKVRGPASHIYERYLQLSRDAASAGDRVLSENYAQHADHYFRLVRSMQPAAPPPQPQGFNEGGEFEGEEGAGGETAEANGETQASGDDGADQPDVDFPSGEQQQQQFNRERGEGDFRGRRRGRRNRYRGDGERVDGEARPEGGEREAREDDGDPGVQRAERQDRVERPERPERPERRERQPRERDGEQGGPEGFSNGPKPAFLRDN